MYRSLSVTALAATLLSGCVTTQEMPLAPNQIRLDTSTQGLLFMGQGASQTMRRAAELTLQNGYDMFRLEQVGTGQGNFSLGAMMPCTGGMCTAGDINMPTSRVGATVLMFHRGEPGSANAFDARKVLAQYASG